MLNKQIQQEILNYCSSKGYVFSEDENTYTIVYIEGMSVDGTLNLDLPNHFNDIRTIFDNRLECLQVWSATTEPGKRYTVHPMNPLGAARIAFGQYKAWSVGIHGNSEPHKALIQVAPVKVHRDLNKDYVRTNDKVYEGLFGINQHWGYDLPEYDIANASAGCLVGRTREGHKEFMEYIYKDKRYKQDKEFVFPTIIIPGNKL